MKITKEEFEERIFYSPCGCWLWIGATINDKYGKLPMGRSDKTMMAHRGSYILYKGDIPTGMDVCHTCDIPLCVNPDHLFLGTHKDNMEDMKRKGRQRSLCGSQNPTSLITEDQASHIKGLLSIGLQPTLLSRCLPVGITIIQNIKRGITWKHVPPPKICGV